VEKASAPVRVKNSDAIALELTAQGRANVVFRTEGQPTETLTMAPGESATLHAEKQASLIVNNASVLQAKLNGKALSFGNAGAGQFVITPEGIDFSRSHFGRVAAGPDGVETQGNRNAIGTAARQRELTQAADSVRLLIKSPAIPEVLTLIVQADNEILFRRDSTAVPPKGLQAGQRQLFAPGVPTTAFADERLLPPGLHTLQVSMLLGRVRLGPPQEIMADFNPKDRRTLLIEFASGPQRGQRGANRFNATLTP
jgi:hypothetical protein